MTAFGGAALSAAWPVAARAQQTRKIPRIGVLWHAGSAEEEGPYFKGLIEGWTNLGYIDGRNIILEHRFPNETPDLFRSMAAELVSSKVDVLIGVGSQTAPYVKSATTTIPIIFVFSPDPVGTRLVSSLAQPGGNATGLTNFAADLIGKRLQYLKDAVPGLSRVALLVNPATQVARLYTDVTEGAAAKLNLINRVFEAQTHNELEQTFDRMAQSGMQAVTINSTKLQYVAVRPFSSTRYSRARTPPNFL
jgi:putative ABC transport system substrate-binding protein